MDTSVKVATEIPTEDTTFGALKVGDEVEGGQMKISVAVSGCDSDEGVLYALVYTAGLMKGWARTEEAKTKVKKIVKNK